MLSSQRHSLTATRDWCVWMKGIETACSPRIRIQILDFEIKLNGGLDVEAGVYEEQNGTMKFIGKEDGYKL